MFLGCFSLYKKTFYKESFSHSSWSHFFALEIFSVLPCFYSALFSVCSPFINKLYTVTLCPSAYLISTDLRTFFLPVLQGFSCINSTALEMDFYFLSLPLCLCLYVFSGITVQWTDGRAWWLDGWMDGWWVGCINGWMDGRLCLQDFKSID